MGRPLKYRELVKILRQHDARFEFFGTELRKGVISAIRRRFKLPHDLF